jgi:hypothetical protein
MLTSHSQRQHTAPNYRTLRLWVLTAFARALWLVGTRLSSTHAIGPCLYNLTSSQNDMGEHALLITSTA